MNLYELTGALASLRQMAGEEEIDPETFADTWESVEGAFEDKADGYAKVRADIINDIAGIDAEIKRLTAKKANLTKNKERLEKSLEEAMRATGKTKFRTLLYSLGIQKSPAHVVVDDETAVPAEYWVPQEPKLDRAGMKTYLSSAAAEKVPWAHLEQDEKLRIH